MTALFIARAGRGEGAGTRVHPRVMAMTGIRGPCLNRAPMGPAGTALTAADTPAAP